MGDPFDEHLGAWREYCASPWGRIRFAVVAEVLARHAATMTAAMTAAMSATGCPPLRVLDVGGGDGRDSVPLAVAGHRVTVLDPAPGMLAEARARAQAAGVEIATEEASLDDLPTSGGGAASYDLVLCHFVLHYRSPDEHDLARLAGLLAPGGRLSVIAPNPAARVLSSLVRRGPAAALEQLETESWSSVTFGGHAGRLLEHHEVEAELTRLGLTVLGRSGGRIANDLLTDDALKHDPAYFADLLRLELALCEREPFWRAGMYWHLVAGARS